MPPTMSSTIRQKNFIQPSPAASRLPLPARERIEVRGRARRFRSSALLQPFFPAALQNENVFELRFVAQSFCDIAGGVAAFGAAIDDDFFLGRPVWQKLRQQFIPVVFVY